MRAPLAVDRRRRQQRSVSPIVRPVYVQNSSRRRDRVRLGRLGRALGAAALATTTTACVLTACGSDDNRPSASATASSGPADAAGCGGKNVVTAEGSTAEQNAIAVFNQVWGQYCPGKAWPTTRRGRVPAASSSSPAMSISPGQIRRWSRVRSARPTKRCNGNPAWDLPLVFGPVALVYNLPGLRDVDRQWRCAGQDLQRQDHQME